MLDGFLRGEQEPQDVEVELLVEVFGGNGFERGEVVPARSRIESLLEWVAPVADEIGAAPYLNVPDANSSERQYARVAELGSHREVFAELVRRPRERIVG